MSNTKNYKKLMQMWERQTSKQSITKKKETAAKKEGLRPPYANNTLPLLPRLSLPKRKIFLKIIDIIIISCYTYIVSKKLIKIITNLIKEEY